MTWSFKLAEFGGTVLRIHLTFLLLLAWIAALYWMRGGPAAALDGVVFILLVFLCVALHEGGHVIAARRYGIRTPDVTLYPFGGIASLERMPEKPGQEIIVALAGPAVNVVIAIMLYIALGARFDFADISQIEAAQMTLAGRLAAVNVVLVLFNLIPAFPTDGGRVLRAVLAFRMDRVRATRYAAYAGQAFAAVFAFVGLFGNPFLLLIAVFIFFAATAESQQVEQQAMARGLTARDAMIRRYESLGPGSTAEDASRLLLLTTQQEFPVLDEAGGIHGMVTRQGLIEAMKAGGPTTPVTEFMIRDLPIVAEDADLQKVLDQLAQSASRTVGVRDRTQRFLGYVSRENLSELFMINAARRESGGR